jgi:hypothetical protein
LSKNQRRREVTGEKEKDEEREKRDKGDSSRQKKKSEGEKLRSEGSAQRESKVADIGKDGPISSLGSLAIQSWLHIGQ